MTLFIALNEIREQLDSSLAFDFVCRAGICGSCGMVVNGRPGLACRTLTKDLPADITLAPLPAFELIADLSVNTGKWMRGMSERLETWVHSLGEERDLRRLEERMEPGARRQDLRARPLHRVRLLRRGLRHGAHARGLRRRRGPEQDRALRARPARLAHRRGLLRARRQRRRRVRLHDAARLPRRLPEELPLQTQIAFLRRKMAREGLG